MAKKRTKEQQRKLREKRSKQRTHAQRRKTKGLERMKNEVAFEREINRIERNIAIKNELNNSVAFIGGLLQMYKERHQGEEVKE